MLQPFSQNRKASDKNALVEAVKERLELFLDRVLQSVRDHKMDVLFLVLLGHGNRCATLFQLDNLLFAELVVLDRELLLREISS